jgi:hypothetical protein
MNVYLGVCNAAKKRARNAIDRTLYWGGSFGEVRAGSGFHHVVS